MQWRILATISALMALAISRMQCLSLGEIIAQPLIGKVDRNTTHRRLETQSANTAKGKRTTNPDFSPSADSATQLTASKTSLTSTTSWPANNSDRPANYNVTEHIQTRSGKIAPDEALKALRV